MIVVKEESIAKAWKNAIKHLHSKDGWRDFHLIIAIEAPTKFINDDGEVFQKVDLFLKAHGQSLNTVAETIFPGSLYKRYGSEGVYEVYPREIYPLIKKANPWGTYAHRMVRGIKEGKTINPLKIVAERMKRELATSKKRACYELSLGDETLTDIPIFDNKLDIGRIMGGPCLSHLTFKLNPDSAEVHLMAIYRSHYYIHRALGNLLGLARLQSFVAKEIGGVCGELVCASSYAKLDYGQKKLWGKPAVSKLLSDLEVV